MLSYTFRLWGKLVHYSLIYHPLVALQMPIHCRILWRLSWEDLQVGQRALRSGLSQPQCKVSPWISNTQMETGILLRNKISPNLTTRT
jgi:hypothetical protein